jgi:hypothetical protein
MAMFTKSILCFGVVTVCAVAHLTSSHASAPNQQTVSGLHVVGQQLAASHNIHWFKAPREFQVVDDHPIIRNFMDDAPLDIDEGTSGCGGQGAGSLDGRGPATIPAGGIPLSLALAGTVPAGNLSEAFKAGFGHCLNTSGRSLYRPGTMRDGITTNRMMGKIVPGQM